MAKANLILPDGTKVKIDGSAEEVASMISKLSQTSVTQRKKKKPKRKKVSRPKTKAKRPSIVRGLNLHPKGKKPFKDFFAEKTPRVGEQTYVVCVYYLEKLLGLKNISIDHVYTCMKEVKRKPPNNLSNAMAIVSSRKGRIDTSNFLDITITVPGENLVEYDLQTKKRN